MIFKTINANYMNSTLAQKKRYIKYKNSKKGIIILVFVFIFITIFGIFYINHLQKLIHKNICQNIKEFGEQVTTQLQLAINEQMNAAKFIADFANKSHITTIDQFFENFTDEEIASYNFKRLVLLDRNGNGRTSDNVEIKNCPKMDEFFEKADGKIYLTENRNGIVDENTKVNIYAKKVNIGGKDYILMATVNSTEYKNLLVKKLFGQGGTYLITKEGAVLIDSYDNIKDSTQNLYSYFKSRYNITEEKEIKKIDEMEKSILAGGEGTFDINFITNEFKNSSNETYYVNYEKLNINDWYVVTTASDSTIAHEFIRIEIVSIFLCLVTIAIISFISIYILSSNYANSRKIYNTAYIDPITGLGNEAFFRGNGTVFIEENTLDNKYIVTLDINKFKALNTVHGYAFCNKILKALGEKLKDMLPKNNITCRISNDIFATIFSYDGDIKEFLSKMSQSLSVVNVENKDININVAIGAYNIDPKDDDINKVLDKAYLARAQVKGIFNFEYYIYDEILVYRMMEAQKLESCMKESLENKEFVVYYQPKVVAKTGKVVGAEALVRWIKNGQIISPNTFIPLFEKNKFIIKLDLYIFEKVCQDLAEWKSRYKTIPTVSVNVSKEHFIDENFINKYVEICEKYGIKPSSIDLEITESATIDKNIDILKILNKIKRKGFIISIDDFGTGYSSLSMLQNMPIDIIKVDKVFVSKADFNSDSNIINYILLMAEHLGTKTIVEGVETQEQVDFVNSINADMIQGYFFSKPIPKNDFEEYFAKNT